MIPGYVTLHFEWAEIGVCHDGTPVPDELRPRMVELCELMEVIRADFGGPLIVLSGYRTVEYNRRIGGAPHSQHPEARAADIRPVSVLEVARLHRTIVERMHAARYTRLGGLGRYPQWVHVDTRPRPQNGHVAQWAGTGIGSEV